MLPWSKNKNKFGTLCAMFDLWNLDNKLFTFLFADITTRQSCFAGLRQHGALDAFPAVVFIGDRDVTYGPKLRVPPLTAVLLDWEGGPHRSMF